MYIVSQIFVIISYVLLSITYGLKNRKSILLFSFASLISNAIGFLCLSAWSGLAMSIVAIIRNVIFLIQSKKDKSLKMTYIDLMVLISLFSISIVSAIFTYEGFLSLLSVAATMLYTYSVWQKNTKVYRIIGVPVSVLWICYNFFIKSIFGIILEGVLLVCEIIGVVNKTREERVEKEKEIYCK